MLRSTPCATKVPIIENELSKCLLLLNWPFCSFVLGGNLYFLRNNTTKLSVLIKWQSLLDFNDLEDFQVFLKMGHSRPFFLYFRLFNTVDSKEMFKINIFPMTGFEPLML